MQKNEADCTLSQRLSETRGPMAQVGNAIDFYYTHATLEIVFWTNFYSVRCKIFGIFALPGIMQNVNYLYNSP